MADVTINIDLGKKCAECGKGGATDSGICLACVNKAICGKTMKSPQGRAVQARLLAEYKRPKYKRPGGE